ncbi:MAG: TlpA family protein disulfide reductase [Tissierellia bacterium]|nr:TlpA family protein disulfide reductase [Tissierellia bacterium]
MKTKTAILGVLLLAILSITSCKNNEVIEQPANLDEMRAEDKLLISGHDLDSGEIVGLSMLEGKEINIISIWQPNCPPCEIELKAMDSIYKENEDVGFIGISVGDNSEIIKDTLNDWEITFSNYRISDDFFNSILSRVNRTPTVFFVDGEGYEIMDMQVGLGVEGLDVENVKVHLNKIIEELRDEK